MTSPPPAEVLVMEAPLVLVMEASLDRRELDTLLGKRLVADLQARLYERATAFAGRVGQGAFATAPPAARLSDAVSRLCRAGLQPRGEAPAPPLLIVWPELVRLGDRHAAGALEDLQSGADVVFGPVIDGGLYLLGLREPFPSLLERLDDELAADEPGALGLAAASEMGLEIGLLRVERGLRTAEDVEAALADPHTPADIRRILAG